MRNPIRENFDRHHKVNYAAIASTRSIHMHKKIIQLNIELDEEICSIVDYLIPPLLFFCVISICKGICQSRKIRQCQCLPPNPFPEAAGFYGTLYFLLGK